MICCPRKASNSLTFSKGTNRFLDQCRNNRKVHFVFPEKCSTALCSCRLSSFSEAFNLYHIDGTALEDKQERNANTRKHSGPSVGPAYLATCGQLLNWAACQRRAGQRSMRRLGSFPETSWAAALKQVGCHPIAGSAASRWGR